MVRRGWIFLVLVVISCNPRLPSHFKLTGIDVYLVNDFKANGSHSILLNEEKEININDSSLYVLLYFNMRAVHIDSVEYNNTDPCLFGSVDTISRIELNIIMDDGNTIDIANLLKQDSTVVKHLSSLLGEDYYEKTWAGPLNNNYAGISELVDAFNRPFGKNEITYLIYGLRGGLIWDIDLRDRLNYDSDSIALDLKLFMGGEQTTSRRKYRMK